jgi:hypothetical protein
MFWQLRPRTQVVMIQARGRFLTSHNNGKPLRASVTVPPVGLEPTLCGF